MALSCGIVGLPNVGKSSLFNALTATMAAESANYPFCTIEPNVGQVSVPDPRLDRLASIAHSAECLPTQISFVDIAGLVEGASRGEGLGNKFLGHVREVDAVVHVVRCFEDSDVIHVAGSVDPLRDVALIELELILADLEAVQKRLQGLEKKIKHDPDPLTKLYVGLLKKLEPWLQEGKSARDCPVLPEERAVWNGLHLLTTKPVVYVANVLESEAASGNEWSRKLSDHYGPVVVIASQLEAEVAQLDDPADKRAFLEAAGLDQTGLSRLILASYRLLDLVTFFTVGPKEARAWTIPRGTLAPGAAGVIHTDFEKGFIRAETIAYEDYVTLGGESGARAAGKMRLEGKDYVVQDGDVLHFRFNV